jgi:hypothetical protein
MSQRITLKLAQNNMIVAVSILGWYLVFEKLSSLNIEFTQS